MIITKTPLRISFAGGGSDYISKSKIYGEVISVTINKYIYVMVNKKHDNKSNTHSKKNHDNWTNNDEYYVEKNGKEYDVKVVKILEFGAVVEFRPGKEVLLHISEIAWERVEKVEKYLNIGDITKVKYMGIDSRTRKQKVSRKILLERPKKKD